MTLTWNGTPALAVLLGGEQTVFRLAIGRIHARGKESGVEIDSVLCALTESKGTKGKDTRAISLRTYFDLKVALEAAGARE